MISVIISFLFVNLFDTAGTLLGVASRANLIEDSGKIVHLDKALKADSYCQRCWVIPWLFSSYKLC